MQLFLDCDGVLADFDRGVKRLLGLPPAEYQQRYGAGKFWAALAKAPGFYEHLPLMPDAIELFEGVRHLNPVILTGLPRGNWAAPQKVRWAARHFPGTRIITCMAIDKRSHCTEDDVLVDDTPKYRDLWEGAGGHFVLHRSAAETLHALARFAELRVTAPETARAV
jgi:hypothetical protein